VSTNASGRRKVGHLREKFRGGKKKFERFSKISNGETPISAGIRLEKEGFATAKSWLEAN